MPPLGVPMMATEGRARGSSGTNDNVVVVGEGGAMLAVVGINVVVVLQMMLLGVVSGGMTV